jgi:hypothetical protein
MHVNNSNNCKSERRRRRAVRPFCHRRLLSFVTDDLIFYIHTATGRIQYPVPVTPAHPSHIYTHTATSTPHTGGRILKITATPKPHLHSHGHIHAAYRPHTQNRRHTQATFTLTRPHPHRIPGRITSHTATPTPHLHLHCHSTLLHTHSHHHHSHRITARTMGDRRSLVVQVQATRDTTNMATTINRRPILVSHPSRGPPTMERYRRVAAVVMNPNFLFQGRERCGNSSINIQSFADTT